MWQKIKREINLLRFLFDVDPGQRNFYTEYSKFVIVDGEFRYSCLENGENWGKTLKSREILKILHVYEHTYRARERTYLNMCV